MDRTTREWKGGWSRAPQDFRIVCDCQLHARRERTLVRRSLRLAQKAGAQIKRRGVAFAVGVPIAFGVLVFPMDAMNLALPQFAEKARREIISNTRTLPLITPRVRESFLHPERQPEIFTFEGSKEEFFRTQVPYGPIIYREAKKNQLPPELVAAIVEAESDFRPRLVSNKNAKGLMQLVPETGRLMGKENLFDPADNIAAGTKYLRYLFDRFGDQKMVLAAYNAGEGNVERFGGIPPFEETQNYLVRVAARTRQYDQRIRGRFIASMKLRRAADVE